MSVLSAPEEGKVETNCGHNLEGSFVREHSIRYNVTLFNLFLLVHRYAIIHCNMTFAENCLSGCQVSAPHSTKEEAVHFFSLPLHWNASIYPPILAFHLSRYSKIFCLYTDRIEMKQVNKILMI